MSVCLLAGVVQIEATSPRGLISEVWTPWVNNTRHTTNEVTGHHFCILWAIVEFSHYKQWDGQMPLNQ